MALRMLCMETTMGIFEEYAELAEKRLAVCKQCERYNEKNHTCRECGCYLKIKAYVPIFKCPLHKWD